MSAEDEGLLRRLHLRLLRLLHLLLLRRLHLRLLRLLHLLLLRRLHLLLLRLRLHVR